MTTWHGDAFHIIEESTGDWWIPSQKASKSELSCLLRQYPEQAVEQTVNCQ